MTTRVTLPDRKRQRKPKLCELETVVELYACLLEDPETFETAALDLAYLLAVRVLHARGALALQHRSTGAAWPMLCNDVFRTGSLVVEHRCRSGFRVHPDGSLEILRRGESEGYNKRRRYAHRYDFILVCARLPNGVLWRRCLRGHVQDRKSCGRHLLGGLYLRGEGVGRSTEFVTEFRYRVKITGDGVCTRPRFRDEDADLPPNVPRNPTFHRSPMAQVNNEECCPASPDGAHDPATITPADGTGRDRGVDFIVDVTCRRCGRSGSVRLDPKEVDW